MKTRIIFIALALFFGLNLSAQDKFLTKAGRVQFYSTTPMEEVKAVNNQATSYIDTKTGEVAVQMLMKGFKFPKALMEEHFNENYVESSKFPKAEFKGKITNLGEIQFAKEGKYTAKIEGTITMHGTTKKISEKASIEIKGGKLLLNGKFNVAPQDFAIKIPDLVKDKIAKTVEVTVDMTYDPYKK